MFIAVLVHVRVHMLVFVIVLDNSARRGELMSVLLTVILPLVERIQPALALLIVFETKLKHAVRKIEVEPVRVRFSARTVMPDPKDDAKVDGAVRFPLGVGGVVVFQHSRRSDEK